MLDCRAGAIPIVLFGGACFAQTLQFSSGVTTGTIGNVAITEASSVVASRVNTNVLWTEEDSGNPAQIYAMTPAGTNLGTYTIAGASNTDWEDMAAGPGPIAGTQYLYIGDIGDNNSARAKIEVYRVVEPVVSDTQSTVTTSISGAAKFTFGYPDGAHDAESLFVDPLTKDIYIITKRDVGVKYVFEAPYPQSTSSTTTLTLAYTLNNNTALTAADISPDGSEIIIRSYATNSGLLYKRPAGGTIADAFATTPIAIPLVTENQGEGIGFDPQGRGYYTTSEGTSQPIHYFDLLPPPATAVYWDNDSVVAGNRATTGALLGGTGSWDATSLKWYNGSCDVPWQNSNDAVFWGNAGTVTLSAARAVNSLTFKTTGYTIAASTLTLNGSSITVDSGVSATISSTIGGFGLIKNGAGTLNLTGSNTFNAGLIINGGIVSISADNNLGSTSTNSITIDGGTLSLSNTSPISLNVFRSMTIGPNGGTINTALTGTGSDSWFGALSGGASAVLTKTGTGNLFLNANSAAYQGKWIINGGEINPGNSTTGDNGWGAVPAHFVSDFFTLNNTSGSSLAGIRAGAGADYTIHANRGITLGANGGTINTVASTANVTIAGVISGAGPLSVLSSVTTPGTIVLTGANTYTGGTILSAGTLVLRNTSALGSGPLTLAGGTLQTGIPMSFSNPISLTAPSTIDTAGNNATYNGSIASTSSLTKSGIGKLSLTSVRTAGLTVAAGTLAATAGGGDTGTSRVSSLSVTSLLDLNDHSLIIDYTASSPAASIRQMLTNGYGPGDWSGISGITSSIAHADPNHHHTLAYAEAAALGISNFAGQSIPGEAVVIKYTYPGDNNLDGIVDLDNDFSLFVDGYNTQLSNPSALNPGNLWTNGDYNYDGVIDLDNDFSIFVDSYAAFTQNPAQLASIINSMDLTMAQKNQLMSAVPEPASPAILIVIMGAIGLRVRRRHKFGRY